MGRSLRRAPLCVRIEQTLNLGSAGIAPTLKGDWNMTLGTILLIILVLLLIGALPNWGYSRAWGRGPAGILGVILVIVLILVLLGRL